ncbi:partial 4-hydroxybenzoyl-CoA reductase subunit alpha, partial [uncultured bacterium]
MAIVRTNNRTRNDHQLNKGVWTGAEERAANPFANGEGKEPEFNVIGKRMPLKDAYKKVTGEGVYTDDMKFPGMLFARVLHSTETHAKIKRIDTSRAEALPGVRAVCIGADAPIKFGVLPVSNDETAMAVDKVIYAGEPVAAVAADSEAIAEQAIWLIEVEYEPLQEFLK